MVFGRDKKPKVEPKPAPRGTVEIETIVGANTSVKGEVRSSGGLRVEALGVEETDSRPLKPGEVCVRMHAVSLNYRDLR